MLCLSRVKQVSSKMYLQLLNTKRMLVANVLLALKQQGLFGCRLPQHCHPELSQISD